MLFVISSFHLLDDNRQEATPDMAATREQWQQQVGFRNAADVGIHLFGVASPPEKNNRQSSYSRSPETLFQQRRTPVLGTVWETEALALQYPMARFAITWYQVYNIHI